MIHPFTIVLAMVALDGAGGQTIYVNPQEITVITGPEVAQMHENVKCVVGLTNGKFISLADTCDEVWHRIDEAEGK